MKYSIDQSQIKDNPHPAQRYELVVTSEAPAPFDSVYGTATYTVANVECVPKLPVEGAREVPNTSREFKLITADGGKTWRGYFYRDMIQDADYFGMGACQWDVESVGAGLRKHGESFGVGVTLQEMLAGKTYTVYSSRSEFFDKALNNGIAREWRVADGQIPAEVTKDPAAFFPMTISVKEVGP